MNLQKLESLGAEKRVIFFQKQRLIIRIQWIVILSALIVFVILPLTIKLIRKGPSITLTTISRTIADPTIESYRKTGAYQRLSWSFGPKVETIVHDIDSFRTYRDFFIDFRDNHSKLGNNYAWKVGFYPSLYVDSVTGNARLGIYLIPTMLDTVKNVVADYNLYKSSTHYTMRTDGTVQPDNYIYDQGTIFP